jgi:hypothetical protein
MIIDDDDEPKANLMPKVTEWPSLSDNKAPATKIKTWKDKILQHKINQIGGNLDWLTPEVIAEHGIPLLSIQPQIEEFNRILKKFERFLS